MLLFHKYCVIVGRKQTIQSKYGKIMERELLITADFPARATTTVMDFSTQTLDGQESRTSLDKQIVLKVQAGQTENFVLLYDNYLDKIYRFLFFRTNHEETAEDLTSQTFLKALDKIKSFDAEKGTFQAWLYRIAHNLLVDHYRSPRKDVDLDQAVNIADESSPEKDVDDLFNTLKAKKLLSTLPEQTQTLIILRVWEDLSYTEISKIMDKSEASLKMQFSRAVSALRNSPLLLSLIIFLMWS